MKLVFRCRSCHHAPMKVKEGRAADALSTALELFCPQCGASFHPCVTYEKTLVQFEEQDDNDK